MDDKNNFLKKIAIIVDNIEKLNFESKKTSLTITLDKKEYDELYVMFDNRIDNMKNTFSIFMDGTEIKINNNILK